MPFMQVGTSWGSAVSRGIDYTFTWKQRLEKVALGILPFADRQIPGPACYEAFRLHPGLSTPESLRGSSDDDLTLGITRDVLQTSGGLHRFEPVVWTGSLPPRAMSLTRQGISLSCVTFLMEWVSRFCSAHLCTSPCSSDHIILRRSSPEIWRMASEDSERGAQSFLLVVCTGWIFTHG